MMIEVGFWESFEAKDENRTFFWGKGLESIRKSFNALFFCCLRKLTYNCFQTKTQMKKSILTLFLGLFLLNTQAQNDQIKMNILALSLGNISLQYEHTLNTHSSLCLGFSFLPSRGFPSVAVDKNSSDYDATAMKLSGWAITPEYRYYFSNKGPKGFYVAPYFRYASYSLSGFGVNYASVTGGTKDRSAIAEGDITTAVGGLMFGSQWTLGSNWTLDWWILGAGFGSQKGTFTAYGNFTQENQDDIHSSIADVDAPGIDLTVTTTATTVEVAYKSSLPALRGFGLCLGYRF